MAEIIGQSQWSPVRLLEENELASGGEDGNMNEQAKALVNRTEYLNEEKASKTDIVQGQFSFTTLAAFDAKKATLPLNCTVIIDEAGPNQGTNTWTGTELKKSSYDPVQQSKGYTDSLVKSKPLGTQNLNKVLIEGIYFQSTAANATLENGYPSFGVAKPSVLHVIVMGVNTSMQVLDVDGRLGTRITYNSTNENPTWTGWVQGLNSTDKNELVVSINEAKTQAKKPLHFSVSGTFGSVNYDKKTKVLSWATPIIATTKNATPLARISIAAHSVTFSGAAFETLYLDLNNTPADGNITSTNIGSCLKLGKYFDSGPDAFKDEIHQVPIAQMTPQGVLAKCAGVIFDIISEAPKVDGFRYTKTASALSVFLPAKNGNLIQFNIPRNIVPFDVTNTRSQLDLWRVERALEVSANFTELQEIATWGEIEFTMRERAYPADHVGGTHGDELLTNAFFVVDGVYKPQDFTVVGAQVAKEIWLEQISNIYRLNTNIPIALHKKRLQITDKWLIAYQEVEMLVTTEADRFWGGMLTMRRKSIDKAVQITKYDIREGVMRDISTTEFEKVYTPVKNGTSVLVCGDQYSGSVEISNIVGFLSGADCFVSNDAAYNKIYVSAIGSTTSGVVLEAGKKFSWTTKYKIEAM
ncbi:pyocin knob domain-containing protein [Acinetobacter baumannii]